MEEVFTNEKEVVDSVHTVRAYYHNVSELEEITPHHHDFYELNIVLNGNGRHDEGKFFYAVGGGEVFIVPPKVEHSYMFVGGGRVFHLLLSDEFLSEYSSVLEKADGFNMLFNTQPELRIKNGVSTSLTLSKDLLEKVKIEIEEFFSTELKDNPLLTNVTALKLLVRLCGCIALSNKTNKKAKSSGAILALDYISRNCANKITLEELCEISYTSRTALIAEFKDLTGKTPQKYLADYRLNKAYELLKTTDKKVTEIANECGFYDNAHFCKEFKRTFGKTPKNLREGL